jgi:hypothetical protein
MSMISSLASQFSAIQAAQTQQEVGMAVAKKSLDATKQQGQAAISLLESAAQIQKMSLNPSVGRKLDVTG